MPATPLSVPITAPATVHGTIYAPAGKRRRARGTPVPVPPSPPVRGPVRRTLATIGRFFVTLVRECLADGIDDLAAMMTYYAIMALFPMVLFVLTLALVLLPADLVHETATTISGPLPPAVATILHAQVEHMRAASTPMLAVLGGVLALWGASRGAATLTTALNRVYSKDETRPFLRRQVRAVVVTALVALIIVGALGFFLYAPEIGGRLATRLGVRGETFDTVWWFVRWIGAALLATFLWALLYKTLPNTKAPLHMFTPGALVGVVLWAIVSHGLTMVIRYMTDFQATYGAFAASIIFLLWLWLSNLALLVGAEINDVLAEMRAKISPAAQALDDPDEHEGPPDADAGADGEPRVVVTPPAA
ncbi:MAG TPA: YihY/virulence factor BrkB family protein [Kofleriaceae bacterium]|nr:YihY/virulence factor BrkB family protein [Kofleriaceae bacterium]